jgi:hypothetical protein
MADDKTKTGKPDRDRINVSEAYEVTYWTNRFDVSPEKLTNAVANVGPMVKDVARYLGKSVGR